MRRLFNDREKQTLFARSDGRCQNCGELLFKGWHADHVHPYHAGGLTELENGQALCQACNLAKGAGTKSEMGTWDWPEGIQPRGWQENAYAAFVAKGGRDFLCSSSPATGKTMFGLFVAARQFASGAANYVVIVVPGSQLKRQWTRSAARFGIELTYKFENSHGRAEPDYHGVVVTYQQVASNPGIMERMCREKSVFLIFDEPHHMGDDGRWGKAAEQAFERAVYRLLITGTPFRSDGHGIPFCRYDANNQCIPDFSHSYGAALSQDEVRWVGFPAHEGEMTWYTTKYKQRTATFADDVPQDEEARRLLTALDVTGEWLYAHLQKADIRLNEIRHTVAPDAGGLVTAIDQEHARQICRLLEKISGEMPDIATSDDPSAVDVIERFAKGTKKWLVSVRMVSEGVDIPRLLVGVYATNVMTLLFFMQFVGRFIRKRNDNADEVADVFIPAVNTLKGYVQHIKEEQSVALERIKKEPSEPRGERDTMPLAFQKLGATHIPDGIIFDQDHYTQEECDEARAVAIKACLPPTQQGYIVKALRAFKEIHPEYLEERSPVTAMAPTITTTLPLLDRKERQKKKLGKLVSALVFRIKGTSSARNHKEINTLLGIATEFMGDAKEEHLQQREAILLHWLSLVSTSHIPWTDDEWLKEARIACESADRE